MEASASLRAWAVYSRVVEGLPGIGQELDSAPEQFGISAMSILRRRWGRMLF